MTYKNHLCYTYPFHLLSLRRKKMKNKLSAVLAFTSILTMGNVNAENLSPLEQQ